MCDYRNHESEMMNLRDSLKGIVKEQNRWGLFIDLEVEDDMEEKKEIIPAFGYWGIRLPKGTKVMCSVKKWAKEDRNILVTIDSVEYDGDKERNDVERSNVERGDIERAA